MAEVAAFLLVVAIARGVHACIENPAGSMLFSFLREHFEPFQPILCTSIADRCRYSEEPMGERPRKPYKFLASGRWIHGVNGRCQCVPKKHLELMKVNANGRTSGTPALRASQAYPRALGEALVSAWATAGPVPEAIEIGTATVLASRRPRALSRGPAGSGSTQHAQSRHLSEPTSSAGPASSRSSPPVASQRPGAAPEDASGGPGVPASGGDEDVPPFSPASWSDGGELGEPLCSPASSGPWPETDSDDC